MIWTPIAPLPWNATSAEIENDRRLHEEQYREMMVEFWIYVAVFFGGIAAVAGTIWVMWPGGGLCP